MHTRKWSFKETNLFIKCDEERAIDAAIGASLQARREIERFIIKHPEFRWSLEPLKLNGEYPRVIGLMLRAGERIGLKISGADNEPAANCLELTGKGHILRQAASPGQVFCLAWVALDPLDYIPPLA